MSPLPAPIVIINKRGECDGSVAKAKLDESDSVSNNAHGNSSASANDNAENHNNHTDWSSSDLELDSDSDFDEASIMSEGSSGAGSAKGEKGNHGKTKSSSTSKQEYGATASSNVESASLLGEVGSDLFDDFAHWNQASDTNISVSSSAPQMSKTVDSECAINIIPGTDNIQPAQTQATATRRKSTGATAQPQKCNANKNSYCGWACYKRVWISVGFLLISAVLTTTLLLCCSGSGCCTCIGNGSSGNTKNTNANAASTATSADQDQHRHQYLCHDGESESQLQVEASIATMGSAKSETGVGFGQGNNNILNVTVQTGTGTASADKHKGNLALQQVGGADQVQDMQALKQQKDDQTEVADPSGVVGSTSSTPQKTKSAIRSSVKNKNIKNTKDSVKVHFKLRNKKLNVSYASPSSKNQKTLWVEVARETQTKENHTLKGQSQNKEPKENWQQQTQENEDRDQHQNENIEKEQDTSKQGQEQIQNWYMQNHNQAPLALATQTETYNKTTCDSLNLSPELREKFSHRCNIIASCQEKIDILAPIMQDLEEKRAKLMPFLKVNQERLVLFKKLETMQKWGWVEPGLALTGTYFKLTKEMVYSLSFEAWGLHRPQCLTDSVVEKIKDIMVEAFDDEQMKKKKEGVPYMHASTGFILPYIFSGTGSQSETCQSKARVVKDIWNKIWQDQDQELAQAFRKYKWWEMQKKWIMRKVDAKYRNVRSEGKQYGLGHDLELCKFKVKIKNTRNEIPEFQRLQKNAISALKKAKNLYCIGVSGAFNEYRRKYNEKEYVHDHRMESKDNEWEYDLKNNECHAHKYAHKDTEKSVQEHHKRIEGQFSKYEGQQKQKIKSFLGQLQREFWDFSYVKQTKEDPHGWSTNDYQKLLEKRVYLEGIKEELIKEITNWETQTSPREVDDDENLKRQQIDLENWWKRDIIKLQSVSVQIQNLNLDNYRSNPYNDFSTKNVDSFMKHWEAIKGSATAILNEFKKDVKKCQERVDALKSWLGVKLAVV